MHDPGSLTEALKTLREQLLTDPYFASAESFKPERKKTALLLQAKDDLPEVRVKVFDLLRSLGSSMRFRAGNRRSSRSDGWSGSASSLVSRVAQSG